MNDSPTFKNKYFHRFYRCLNAGESLSEHLNTDKIHEKGNEKKKEKKKKKIHFL